MIAREKIRVLLAKSKMDAHDRGIRFISAKMVEGGFEVILARYGLIEELAPIAEQEDVDVVGLSFCVGGHLASCARLRQALDQRGLSDHLIIAGGVIPEDDVAALKEIGVAGVFGAGSRAEEAVEFVKSVLPSEPGANLN